ncbi:MAG: phenylacetate--CoA ligase [Eubacteriales bacterium]
MFYQKEIEKMPRKKLEALQLERLKWTVDYCIKNVPFYAEKLCSAGVTGNKIKSLDDIRNIPITTKDDLRDNYPIGLFAKPMKDIVRIHASSGTTGKSTIVGYTKKDLDIWSDCVARICVAAGVSDEDIVQISIANCMQTGAMGFQYALEKIGATVIPNINDNAEKTLMYMRDLGTTVLVSTPSLAMYLREAANDLEYSRSKYKLRLGLFGSESCSNEMRTKIEKSWGLFATDNYGVSELIGPGVSGECVHRNGLHFCEDYFYPEIIDTETLEVLDEGETGDLLVTTLAKEGIPLLRYRTRDITRLNYDVCECGRTAVRMDKVKGRSDDMIKIRGVNVFPSQIESVLMDYERIGGNYQLVLRTEAFIDTLEVKVELMDGRLLDSFGEVQKMQKNLGDKIQSTLGLKCKLSLVEPKSLERYAGKTLRILDLRNQ